MPLSPKFQRKNAKKRHSDFTHHSVRRERFRTQEIRDRQALFGNREVFGKREEDVPKRSFFAALRRRRSRRD